MDYIYIYYTAAMTIIVNNYKYKRKRDRKILSGIVINDEL